MCRGFKPIRATCSNSAQLTTVATDCADRTASDSIGTGWLPPYCCRRAASWRPQCTHVLCCPDLRRATTSCPSPDGTALSRPRATAPDASRREGESCRSPSLPAKHIPGKAAHEFSCGRNLYPAFRRQDFFRLSRPSRTRQNPSAATSPSGTPSAPCRTPLQKQAERTRITCNACKFTPGNEVENGPLQNDKARPQLRFRLHGLFFYSFAIRNRSRK